MNALFIIDLSSLLHKAFYIADVGGMVAHCVGTIIRIMNQHRPSHMVACVDLPGPTFRHAISQQAIEDGLEVKKYKADRIRKGPEFYAQCARIERIVRDHAIPILSKSGFEADDCVKSAVDTVVRSAVIVTEDKDLHTLVSDAAGVVVYPGGKDDPFRDESYVRDKWGVAPWQLADLLAIAGDNGDSIRGVDSIGPTRAAAMLNAHGSLDAILARSPLAEDAYVDRERRAKESKKRPESLPFSRAEYMAATRMLRDVDKVLAARPIVELARELVKLRDPGIEIDLDAARVGGFDVEALRSVYEVEGFTRLGATLPDAPKGAFWE